MRPLPTVPPSLTAQLRRQDGAVTLAQTLRSGLTTDQVRSLVRSGWTRPMRGVLVCPDPVDPFRASVRAGLLACPEAVAAGMTAARIHQLWGLPIWSLTELPHLLLPAAKTYSSRSGVRLRSGLLPGEMTTRHGLPVTTLTRTVSDLALLLVPDDLVCALDSALRKGWRLEPGSSPGVGRVRAANALADGRSESTFETLLRLVLVRGGVPPETLQFEVMKDGRVRFRLDFAWPSLKLAVEADGREYHDAPAALYGDRVRANALEVAGWMILRFTWSDLMHDPQGVVDQVAAALNRLSGINRAS